MGESKIFMLDRRGLGIYGTVAPWIMNLVSNARIFLPVHRLDVPVTLYRRDCASVRCINLPQKPSWACCRKTCCVGVPGLAETRGVAFRFRG